jgi:hypothetical protein
MIDDRVMPLGVSQALQRISGMLVQIVSRMKRKSLA